MRSEGFWEGQRKNAPAVGCGKNQGSSGITARRHYAFAEGASLVAVCRIARIRFDHDRGLGPNLTKDTAGGKIKMVDLPKETGSNDLGFPWLEIKVTRNGDFQNLSDVKLWNS